MIEPNKKYDWFELNVAIKIAFQQGIEYAMNIDEYNDGVIQNQKEFWALKKTIAIIQDAINGD